MLKIIKTFCFLNLIFNKFVYVNWTGFFIAKNSPKNSLAESMSRYNSYLNILVKMEPSETERDPDIVIAFTKENYDKNIQFIESLQNGDQVNFNAKFINFGTENTPNLMLGLSIMKTGERKQLGDIKINEMNIPTTIPLDHEKP